MSNNYGNNNQDDSEDERELDEEKNKNQGGMNSNGNNLHPSISKSIVNEQENTGVCKVANTEGQSNNPSLNFNGQNGNVLPINRDNNNNNSPNPSQKSIGQSSQQNNNPSNQMNNFINGTHNNNQVPNYNPNNNNNNFNNNNNNFNNNNNNFNNNNNNFNNNKNNNNNNFNNNKNNNNNFYNNNNNNNFNKNNNIAHGNNMQSFDNQNYSQRQVIGQNKISNNSNQMNNNNQSHNKMNQMSNQSQYPFSNIRNPIKTLLKKVGETEYLNSILYLIGNIRVLCDYFYIPNQENQFVSNIEKAPLSFIIHRLFGHLYPSSENEKNKYYKPDAIKRYLSEINCVYKSQKKRNPNELFSFILDTLHSELKKPPKGEMKNPNNVFNINDVIQTGFTNFQNCDISKISEYFNWFEIKDIRCNQCNRTMYSFQTYHMFELDILNTSIFINNNNNNYNKNNPISIYDCLSYYESRKSNLKGFCKSCNKNTMVECGLHIYSNPNIFVFSLNRGLINGSFDDNLTSIHFQLNDHIDLNNYVNNKQISKKYELRGIVSISGRLNNYVTFCKSPVDNNWYYYDSEKVQLTNMNYILSEHDKTRETDYIPCILVYQLI